MKQLVEPALLPSDLVHSIVSHCGQIDLLCVREEEFALFVKAFLEVIALGHYVELALGVTAIRTVAKV